MVFKQYLRKIRYAKLIRENKEIPIWILLKRFGRIRYVSSHKRNWRYKKVSL